jgi:hypothetical protein
MGLKCGHVQQVTVPTQPLTNGWRLATYKRVGNRVLGPNLGQFSSRNIDTRKDSIDTRELGARTGRAGFR